MVAIETFDIFEYEKEIDRLAVEYHNELQNLLGIRTLEMRYAGDFQGEQKMNAIESKASTLFKQWKKEVKDQDYIQSLYPLLVDAWCVPVKGKVSSYIYDQPIPSKIPKPKIVRNIFKYIPTEIQLDWADKIIGFVLHWETEQGLRIVYYCKNIKGWYSRDYFLKGKVWQHKPDIERSVDRIQKKFVYTRIDDRKEYSQFKIEPRQKWTKQGYEKALEDKMVYFLTVATCTSSMRFYGREEALKRLQEQNKNIVYHK